MAQQNLTFNSDFWQTHQLIGRFFYKVRLTGQAYANLLQNELQPLLEGVPLPTRQQMFL